jgi:hypothetical protein
MSGGDFEASGFGSLTQIIRSLIWSVIWFLYLTFSDQVNTIIPKSYRKQYKIDYYILGLFIVIPVLIFALAFGIELGLLTNENDSQVQNTEIVAPPVLAENEYSDGKIIFTLPQGYTCERQDLENPRITLFDLSKGENEWLRICSDYETDISQRNFTEYWENWKDESLKDFKYKLLLNEKRSIDGNPYYIKSVQYNTDIPIVWNFVQLFNTQTQKVCVITYYQVGECSDCLNELLNSIRFI